MVYSNLAPLRNMCIKFAMQFIQRKVSLNKCLKFKMPKVPKIVERASSTIDLISNVQW
jgi:ArsR family metal-binding transcriptional regulator